MDQLGMSIYYVIIALAVGITVSAIIFILIIYIIYKLKFLEEELEGETTNEEVN